MVVKIQSLIYLVFIVIAVLLSPDAHAYAETIEMEMETEEVCCICAERTLKECIVIPKTSEDKNSSSDFPFNQNTVGTSACFRSSKYNLHMLYCVFRE